MILNKNVNLSNFPSKQGGLFIMVGALEESFYVVGDKQWPTMKFNMQEILDILKEENFNVIQKEIESFDRDETLSSDFTGVFMLVAKL